MNYAVWIRGNGFSGVETGLSRQQVERPPRSWFSALRMADQLLGPYGESSTNEEMVRMVLNNPYEGLTVVDTEGNVTFLSAEMNDG